MTSQMYERGRENIKKTPQQKTNITKSIKNWILYDYWLDFILIASQYLQIRFSLLAVYITDRVVLQEFICIEIPVYFSLIFFSLSFFSNDFFFFDFLFLWILYSDVLFLRCFCFCFCFFCCQLKISSFQNSEIIWNSGSKFQLKPNDGHLNSSAWNFFIGSNKVQKICWVDFTWYLRFNQGSSIKRKLNP